MITETMIYEIKEKVQQKVKELPPKYAKEYPNISPWLIRIILEICERDLCGKCGLMKSMDEVLNTGDGAYRP